MINGDDGVDDDCNIIPLEGKILKQIFRDKYLDLSGALVTSLVQTSHYE